MPATTEGGIKGFLTRAGASFYAGGLFVKEKGWTLAKKAGNVGFMVATTSIVVLMPLIFEIMREGQVSDKCINYYFKFSLYLILILPPDVCR